MSEIAEHLDKDTLKTLKKEYGGLQTLLRNNYQVFKGKKAVPFLSLSGLTFRDFWCELSGAEERLFLEASAWGMLILERSLDVSSRSRAVEV